MPSVRHEYAEGPAEITRAGCSKVWKPSNVACTVMLIRPLALEGFENSASPVRDRDMDADPDSGSNPEVSPYLTPDPIRSALP